MPALIAALVALFVISGAQAVHNDNLFELGPGLATDEGGLTNILGDGNFANGPDWADLFTGTCGNGTCGFKDVIGPGGSSGANNVPDYLDYGGSAAGFIQDASSHGSALDPTTFSGFGTSNKNDDPISTADCASRTPPLTGSACTPWGHDPGNVPSKDDLTNVYSYAKVPSSGDFAGHLILYAGIERETPSGDSHVDVEFFQDQVTLCTPVPPATSCTSFNGKRTVGDIILSMDFLNGGALGSVTIREWDGTTYQQVGVEGGEGCTAAPAPSNEPDAICAFNNGGNINGGPWPNFDNLGHLITTLPQNAFTEVGVDVTALEGSNPCISTFMGKTRSSGDFNSELKDFAGPQSFPFCSASISIAPNKVNEVGASHTFTVTVNKKFGTTTSPAPDGTKATVTLTGSNGITSGDITPGTDTCATTGTVNGTCTVSFSASKAGRVTAHAAADVAFGGETFHVETDGTDGNSGDAVKRYVDGKISIGPSATNGVGEQHIFTVTVQQDDGLTAAQGGDGVTGFAPVVGTKPTVTLTNDATSNFTNVTDNCASTGTNSSGQCTVSFTSNTPGTVTGHASATWTIPKLATEQGSGVTLTRATDGTHGSTGDATKVFVAGSLKWFKDDNAGNALVGATFKACRTKDRFGTAVSDTCLTVTDNDSSDADPADGVFKLTGLKLGHWEVTETVAPPGFAPDPSTKTADLGTAADPNANKDAVITVHFVNQRPIVKITGFKYTNSPVGTPTHGVTHGTAVFTADLHNYGGADATLSGTLVVTHSGAGTVTCQPNSTVNIAGTLAAGGDKTGITTSCEYDLADGDTVTATLNVSYTINGVPRVASGSPATITFTVQSD